jgi:hypothetical protein
MFVNIINDNPSSPKETYIKDNLFAQILIFMSFVGTISDLLCTNICRYKFSNCTTGLPIDIDEKAKILKAYQYLQLDKNVYQYDFKLVDIETNQEFDVNAGDWMQYYLDGSFRIISSELIDSTANPSA